jgi:hypothetical protein
MIDHRIAPGFELKPHHTQTEKQQYTRGRAALTPRTVKRA